MSTDMPSTTQRLLTIGRLLFFVVFVLLAAMFFSAKRTGKLADLVPGLGQPEGVILFDELPQLKYVGRHRQIIFPDGSTIAQDGHGYVLFQASDWERNAERLKSLPVKPENDDFPLLITLNVSGFDVSGEAIAVRRARDGKLLYKAVTPDMVDMALPQRDGSCRVYYLNGKVSLIPEQAWLKDFMRVAAVPPPQGFEKMSDDELKKHGYERLSPDEVEKRLKAGKLKPDQVFPAPRVPDKK